MYPLLYRERFLIAQHDRIRSGGALMVLFQGGLDQKPAGFASHSGPQHADFRR
jgi:hypothetical protein